jgi:uncharacterized coiled-coil DUF342 family protein
MEVKQLLHSTVNSHAQNVKNERAVLGKAIDRYKGKTRELSAKITSLSNRTADALSEARISTLQASQSSKQAQCMMSAATSLQQEVQDLRQQLSKQWVHLLDLVEKLESKDRELTAAEEAVPLRNLGRSVMATGVKPYGHCTSGS